MRRWMKPILAGMALLASACATTETAPRSVAAGEASADTLDRAAETFVKLVLGVGEREEGYVDAYYGPPEWQAEAKTRAATIATLSQEAAELATRLEALKTKQTPGSEEARRAAFLSAHVTAVRSRLRMLAGEKLSFADEAEAQFGIRPQLQPLIAYDPVLAEIDALVPGDGPLIDQVTAFRQAFVIPKDRLEAVMQRAIAECRARTARHIALPANERFTLGLVNDKPWSGYNFYLGDAASRIEINTDFPIYTERAIDLGCHEGYPGHHVYNALLEKTFVRDRGWVEMSVYPLFSPMSFVAEGSANYGIDLAFPGDEAQAFERDVLMPLAGLPPADVAAKARLSALTRRLARAELTIADDYLSGRVDRETTVARLSKYTLATPDKAAQRLRFIDTYRSYIINYNLGRDTVQAWVERPDQPWAGDPWTGMETLLSSQILPADLLPGR